MAEKTKIYSLSAVRGKKRVKVVRVSDFKVSSDSQVTLVTYALGSCIAVSMYDPVERIGGLLHYLLPCSESQAHCKSVSKGAGGRFDALNYADLAIPILVNSLLDKGAVKRRLKVKLAGGAKVLKGGSGPDVGRQNYEAALAVLKDYRLLIASEDVGGGSSRTAMLEIDTGILTIRSGGKIKQI